MTSLAQLAGRWPAISAMLDEALILPASARTEWLAGLDGARAEHRDALRALLATQASVETDDFLAELPRLPSVSIREAPEHAIDRAAGRLEAGALVGPYRLIEEIGRGGMGTVWLAERADGLVHRRVAMKLPRAVWGDALAERFARERDILATLAHAHIARLYDVGIDAFSRPYLAMEFVEGETIDAHCRTHELPLSERIGLLLQVMSAVAHAHARLVVHRDLKPSNILVTKEGQVRLLDFGIAKLLEGELTRETALTELGGRALTLDYASPEQIRGEPLGTASDVYSMAVVAYELLAGGRPYRLKRGSAAELEEAIAGIEAPRASDTATDPMLKRQLRGDLDAILNKALKKQLDDRYPTMDAFAADLRRWCNGEPVQARPDTPGYRLAKFVRRHRLQVAAGSVAVIALAAGASVALWQAREAHIAEAEARTEAATAKAVQGFIESVFVANSGNQPDPERARAATARELLDRGAERVESDLAAEPKAQLRLYDLLGEMYLHMALNDRALALQRHSLALATRLYGASSVQALGASVNVAKTLAESGQRQESLTLLLKADEDLRARGDADELLRMDVDSTLSALYFNTDPPKGLERARRAAVIARRQPPSQGSVNSLHMLGETANATGHLEEAREALVDAAARIDRKPEETAGALPLVLSTLGEVQDKLGQPNAAGVTLAKAYALAQRVSDPYSLHIAGYKLSRYQLENGLLREAVNTASAGAAWARSLASDHEFGPSPAVMIGNYGRALLAYGDVDRALATIDEARAMLPADVPDALGPLLATRADALLALGRTRDAAADLDRATAMIGDRIDRNTEAVRAVRRRYWVAVGRAEEALQDFSANSPKAPQTTTAYTVLRRQAEEAALLLAAGHDTEARTTAAGALSTIDRLPERRFARDAEARMTAVLGQALLREDRVAEALPVLQKALALHLAEYDPTQGPATAKVRVALAEAQRRVGH